MKPGGARQLQTILLMGMIGVLALYFYVQYLLIPMSRDAAAVGRDVRSAREKLRLLEAATANETAIQTQYRQVEEGVAALRKAMPSETELPAVLELLSAVANKSDVKIQTIFPQHTASPSPPTGGAQGNQPAAGTEPPVYKEIPIQIDALAGFHELGTFLSLVETGERPMQVLSMRITGNPKEPRRHQINLVLRAYFSLSGS